MHWPLVLALTVLPVLFKFALVTLLARAVRRLPRASRCAPGSTWRRPASSASSCSASRASGQLLPPELQGPILASMVLSMLATPFIFIYSNRIVMRLAANDWLLQSVAMTTIATPFDQRRGAT